jgi:hypothetical protein
MNTGQCRGAAQQKRLCTNGVSQKIIDLPGFECFYNYLCITAKRVAEVAACTNFGTTRILIQHININNKLVYVLSAF